MARKRSSGELEPIEPEPFEEEQEPAAEGPQHVTYAGTHEDRDGEAIHTSAGRQRRDGEALITDG